MEKQLLTLNQIIEKLNCALYAREIKGDSKAFHDLVHRCTAQLAQQYGLEFDTWCYKAGGFVLLQYYRHLDQDKRVREGSSPYGRFHTIHVQTAALVNGDLTVDQAVIKCKLEKCQQNIASLQNSISENQLHLRRLKSSLKEQLSYLAALKAGKKI